MQGLRGFNDRTTVPLRSGLNAFYQPIDQDNLEEYMLPFRAEANKTNAMCMPAPEMYYPTDIAMWNSGRMDAWNTARDPGLGMSYFTREDMPYYYSLYDNFLAADHYYQSTFTATNPNRMHFFSGSNGLSVGELPVLENDEPRPGFNWTTMAELLEEKGVSWRVYQQLDNFDDNAFAWFATFQKSRPGDSLWDKGMARQKSLIDAFRADLEAGTLPAVSWIIAPTRKSEHATNHPCAGEDFTARILSTLKDFPDTYGKSAFVLNYDEGGQFFDHAWCPTPPLDPSEGASTVSVEGEVNTEVLTDVPAPIGMGFRVPLLVVSPWTRGNLVLSQAMDHTSIIKFLEARFGVECPNISPWRRAMTGDLLAAFDFEHPDYSWPEGLPDTSEYVVNGDVQCHMLPPPEVPEQQSMPQQEPGTRIARALPYEFRIRDEVTLSASGSETGGESGSFSVTVENAGASGAPFVLFDVSHVEAVNPRQLAVEAGKQLTDRVALQDWDTASGSFSYSYVLLGMNGFAREFVGTNSAACTNAPLLKADLSYEPLSDAVVVTVGAAEGAAGLMGEVEVRLADNAYGLLGGGGREVVLRLSPDTPELRYKVGTEASGNWYDLSLYMALSDSQCFRRRFMGHMENGRDSISDPAMAAGVPGLWGQRAQEQHPPLPARLRQIKRVEGERAADDKDARFVAPAGPGGADEL